MGFSSHNFWDRHHPMFAILLPEPHGCSSLNSSKSWIILNGRRWRKRTIKLEQKPIQKIESPKPATIEHRKLKLNSKKTLYDVVYTYTFEDNSWSSKNLNWNKHCFHQYRNRSDRLLPEAEDTSDTSLNHGSLTPLPAFHKWPCYDKWFWDSQRFTTSCPKLSFSTNSSKSLDLCTAWR